MIHDAFHRALACLTAAFIAGCGAAPAIAQPAPAPVVTEDGRMLPYAEPGQLVDIGGRRINLTCSGDGARTVVLMSGISSWSLVWYKVQPEIAKRTRVCAFDRAGFGFSNPPPHPQSISDVADDLHATLTAAHLAPPYVLVGHSLGGQEARVFAQRWPKDVAGLVLVDSSLAGEVLITAGFPDADKVETIEQTAADALKCVMLAARAPLQPSTPGYKDCSLAAPAEAPAALRQVWPRFWSVDHAAAQLSLFASVSTHKYDSVDHRRLGDMPLVVLSADWSVQAGGGSGAYQQARMKWRYAAHEALAHMSSRGVHRIIKGSSHHIELDKPQAVIEAVDEVFGKLQLPASPAPHPGR